jgi:hypothetical protein
MAKEWARYPPKISQSIKKKQKPMAVRSAFNAFSRFRVSSAF